MLVYVGLAAIDRLIFGQTPVFILLDNMFCRKEILDSFCLETIETNQA